MSTKLQGSNGNPIRLLLRVPVPWVYVLTYIAGVGLEMARPLEILKNRTPFVAGIVIFAAGAVIAGWSWLIFHRARTTTVPGEVSAELVMRGPYRISRNPMYAGLAIAYLGEAGILNQAWPITLLPFTLAYINSIVIPLEETRLKEAFQDEYECYRKRVRRWM